MSQVKDSHPLVWPKGIRGLVQRGFWEIPEVMCASIMGLIGIGLAEYGIYKYKQIDGDNRDYHFMYYIMRISDPKACTVKNPVRTEYPKPPVCDDKKDKDKKEETKQGH